MGNTPLAALGRLPLSVHPHACGEHTKVARKSKFKNGSSPRLWGTRRLMLSVVGFRRFIPTPVGNTAHAGSKKDSIAVHPHACGEHPKPNRFALSVYGSSPRLWGTRGSMDAEATRPRFIPTPVGNTANLVAHYIIEAVHPHACGEHDDKRERLEANVGSSPRLWGTRVSRVQL